MTISTLTSKGQATIPKEIRDFLGVKPYEQVQFSIRAHEVVVRRATATTAELAGSLKTNLPLPEKRLYRAAIGKHLARRHGLGSKP